VKLPATKPAAAKTLRCAIYTRKSTEHNLDLAFNSLDAQREACEAYIKSQAHEGWRLIPDRYDDGGLSGASLERPALQTLLADIRARKVDVVVVYKVDRLTRALADFAKLVETFDAHDVAFVSVTQSFNTTSSMGRLTLNVLLSFAQFEREVIGERVRDKIAASKRKGLWLGGPVSLGYRSVDKALVVVPEDAETVRTIYERYLALGSIGQLIEDLHQRGIGPRRQRREASKEGRGVTPADQEATGIDAPPSPAAASVDRFTLGPLAYILKNRIYVGEVVHKGEVHRGRHEPIIVRDLFDAVQARLATAAVRRRTRRRDAGYLLAGLLYDDRGNHMSPSHATKAGVRYRYYVSQAVLQGRKAEAGAVPRIAAPDIEAVVTEAVREHLTSSPSMSVGQSKTVCPPADGDVMTAHVQRVVLHRGEVEIVLNSDAASQTSSANLDQDVPVKVGETDDSIAPTIIMESDTTPASSTVLVVPLPVRVGPARKGIVTEPRAPATLDARARETLLSAIAKARLWLRDILDGRVATLEEVAVREGRSERYIRMLMPLAFLSPPIVARIIDGSAPFGLAPVPLARDLPLSWFEQETRLLAT
jgi:DNA invertase Pin-like site-specific DNA recombinase